jgi:hypothetical protein
LFASCEANQQANPVLAAEISLVTAAKPIEVHGSKSSIPDKKRTYDYSTGILLCQVALPPELIFVIFSHMKAILLHFFLIAIHK